MLTQNRTIYLKYMSSRCFFRKHIITFLKNRHNLWAGNRWKVESYLVPVIEFFRLQFISLDISIFHIHNSIQLNDIYCVPKDIYFVACSARVYKENRN